MGELSGKVLQEGDPWVDLEGLCKREGQGKGGAIFRLKDNMKKSEGTKSS